MILFMKEKKAKLFRYFIFLDYYSFHVSNVKQLSVENIHITGSLDLLGRVGKYNIQKLGSRYSENTEEETPITELVYNQSGNHKKLIPSSPIKVYNYQYNKCLKAIEQKIQPFNKRNLKGKFIKEIV